MPGAEPDIEARRSAALRMKFWHNIAFVLGSGGFLWWMLLGTVEARVWMSGQLHFVDRSIRTMWIYSAQHLPHLPAQSLFATLYWFSLVTIVLGTIVGLWLLLIAGERDDSADLESLRQRVTPEHAEA